MKIKCLIVDDEFPARILMMEYIKKMPQLELKASCKNPLEAMEILQTEEIDLMFLDIQMPELSGIDFLQTLTKKPVTILSTAYPDYALEGYKLDVTDYLLKPFSFERFVMAAQKAIELIALKNGKHLASTESETKKSNDYMLIKADNKLIRIQHDEILYIEGLKEYVSFYTVNDRIITLQSLKNLEEMLPKDRS